MIDNNIKKLFEELEKTPQGDFFNPWFDQDTEHDSSPGAPEIRRRQLRTYLHERKEKAKYLLIAEALGYQGGHFTGIAMTSERILLGHHRQKHDITPQQVFNSVKPERTSLPALKKKGFTEPTATIVWKALHKIGINPYEVVLWNALSWHPYDANKGMLSNRTPTSDEMEAGYPSLKAFFEIFPAQSVVAVGRKSEATLGDLGVKFTGVRHPANGGASKFRSQIRSFMAD